MLYKATQIDCGDSGFSESCNPTEKNGTRKADSDDTRAQSFLDQRNVLRSPIEDLPSQVLTKIIDFLNSVERVKASQVCRKWREILSKEEMWAEISLRDCDSFDLLHIGMFVGFRGFSVEKMDVKNAGNLIHRSLRFLTPMKPTLRYLRLCRLRNMKIDVVIDFLSACPNLVQLDLSKSSFLNPLKSLKRISPNSGLSYLNLDRCDTLTSQMLKNWTKFAPNLSFVHLRHCTRITDDGISFLVKNCPNLTEITVDCCPLLTDEAVTCISQLGATLKSLSAKYCSISDNGVHNLAIKCTNLTQLNLHGCLLVGELGIRALSRNCRILKVVDLSHTQVNDIALRELTKLGFIEQIRMENCPNISEQMIKLVVDGWNVVILDKIGRKRASNPSVLII